MFIGATIVIVSVVLEGTNTKQELAPIQSQNQFHYRSTQKKQLILGHNRSKWESYSILFLLIESVVININLNNFFKSSA